MKKSSQKQELKKRRAHLLTTITPGGIAIVFATHSCCTNDIPHQNSDFYYLTGFNEPDAIAVFAPGRDNGEVILFTHEKNSTHALWYGTCSGKKSIQHDFGIHQTLPLSAANHVIAKLLVKHKNIYTNIDPDGKAAPQIISWRKKGTKNKLIDIGIILHEMRLKKSQLELHAIRKAIDISVRGHLRAMHMCRPGMFEYELEAEILHEFVRSGTQPAFPTIVAGGNNACTLHYTQNNRRLLSGEMILIDAGAKYCTYCADISRTFPINGKFTLKQQALYEVVLAAQTEVLKNIRPGITWDKLQTIAEQTITTGLMQLKLLKHGLLSTALSQQKYKKFFMHKIGHWLGLDTHDVGNYRLHRKWRTLEPGMIFTVEPGIYIPPNSHSKYKHYLGMGIRIEDVVLVTHKGYKILSAALPKTILELEKCINKK